MGVRITEYQQIASRNEVDEAFTKDIISLLEELDSFSGGLLIMCDSDLNSVFEQAFKESKKIRDVLPLSRPILNQLVEMANADPAEIDDQLRSILDLQPSSSGILVPLNIPNLCGFLLVVIGDDRLLTEKELNHLKLVASLASKYYLNQLRFLNKENIANDILDSLDIGIYSISNSGIMVQFNSAAEKLFGYNAKNIIGRDYLECLAPQVRDTVERIVNYVMKEKRIFSENNINFITLKEKEVTLVSTIYPWLDKNGDLLGVVGLVQDETGKRSFQSRLIQLERTSVINQIATNIVHKVQGSLAAIRGFARMIENKQFYDPCINRYAEIIVTDVDRINNVVKTLFDISQPLVLDFELINLNQVITEISRQLFDREPEISLNLNLDERLPCIRGDYEKLSQLFNYLLTNSIEAVDRCGVVEITSKFKGNRVKVKLQDNGYGISQIILERIFDPFFTTKTAAIGVGLAVVRQITASHDGTIKVTCMEGEGTTVILEFPASKEVE